MKLKQSFFKALISRLTVFMLWQNCYYIPTPPKVEWGYTGFTPMSVRPSVRPSVCRQGFRNFFVPSLIFGPLVAKYLAENGVSGTFWKNYWLNSFHTWHLSLWGESLDPYTFYAPSLIFGPLVAKYLAKNGVSGTFKNLLAQFSVFLKYSHLCNTLLQNRNLYWIFLDEVGSDQSIYGHSLFCL